MRRLGGGWRRPAATWAVVQAFTTVAVAVAAAAAAVSGKVPVTTLVAVGLPVNAAGAESSSNNTPSFRFDGIGGLSGGGATSTFLLAYPAAARAALLDWLFLPDFAASLDILKVEVGADDQTTDGCEACHMRAPGEVDCTRGYEWALMREAAARNPAVTLYGLPWGFPGWLGFGTTNPYHNVTATADYMARWVECARDAHGLNVSVLGLWNEAWQAAGRPADEPWAYAMALRARLDGSGLGHVRIVAPDGSVDGIVPALQANATYRQVTWGLGQHYPGGGGATAAARGLGLPLWSSEDYSTYSDATGAGCWARLLVQNAGWGYGATISWYLAGGFARGLPYSNDGFVRAEWPLAGHWEVTPMLWVTLHWTLFTDPGWTVVGCAGTARCALAGGGNYAVLVSPPRPGGDGSGSGDSDRDVTVIVHAFTHNASRCIRNDPPAWSVVPAQNVTVVLPAHVASASPPPAWRWRWSSSSPLSSPSMQLWRSCAGWRFPAADDGYLQRLPDVPVDVTAGTATFTVERDCYYTLTTVRGRRKPPLPTSSAWTSTPASPPTSSSSSSSSSPPPPPASVPARPAAFPLPFAEDFEGATVGGEAPLFGDMQGKWETVPAAGGRPGRAAQQQLRAGRPWPILEPQCNDHGQPLSIIGDMFFESTRVSADVLLLGAEEEEELGPRPHSSSEGGRARAAASPASAASSRSSSPPPASSSLAVGAGLALRVRTSAGAHGYFRGLVPGLFLYVGAVPGRTKEVAGRQNPGGTPPAPNTPLAGWALCTDSYCTNSSSRDHGAGSGGADSGSGNSLLLQGPLPAGAPPMVGHWHSVELEVTAGVARGAVDNVTVFSGVVVDSVTLTAAAAATAGVHHGGGGAAAATRCETDSVVHTDMVIAGFDYKQLPTPPGANSTVAGAAAACVAACCGDAGCRAWAVEGGLCWLKSGGQLAHRAGQNASGLRPVAPAPPPRVPPSGWAALVGTLGRSQVDNFELHGTAGTGDVAAAAASAGGGGGLGGGARVGAAETAVVPCDGAAAPRAGAVVSSTPCDHPGAAVGWAVAGSGGVVQLRPSARDRSTGGGGGAQLCLAAAGANTTTNSSAAVVLQPCDSPAALVYDAATGRVLALGRSGGGSGGGGGNGRTAAAAAVAGTPGPTAASLCLTAVQKKWADRAPPALAMAACAPLPADGQQFQYHPGTGALRQKGSHCIASIGAADGGQYRDCCIALCPFPPQLHAQHLAAVALQAAS